MFVETLKHAGGTTVGTATEAHALLLMRLALQQGGTVEATHDGGVRITQPRAAGVLEIALTPAASPAPFDDTVLPYLAIVATGEAWADTRADGAEVISTFMNVIAPGAAARLYARRLVAEQGSARRVRLTLAGGLGLVAAAHRTSTTCRCAPHQHPLQPLVAPALPAAACGTSTTCSSIAVRAVCACGFAEDHPDADSAALGARGHRRQTTAAFVTRLGAAFTGAVAVASR